MRLITYNTATNAAPRIGVRVGHRVLDIEAASRVDGEPLPATMKTLLKEGRGALSRVQALAKAAQSNAGRFSGAMVEERAIRFLPPIPDPDKFLCVGKNYRAHLEELKKHDLIKEMPEEVTGFVKLTSCLVGHNAKVVKPDAVAHLDYEPELVFVIGRRVLGVSKDDDALRLQALQWALGIDAALLAAALFLVFGVGFVAVLVAHMFSPLVLYLLALAVLRRRAEARRLR
jgi:hypothetical protein